MRLFAFLHLADAEENADRHEGENRESQGTRHRLFRGRDADFFGVISANGHDILYSPAAEFNRSSATRTLRGGASTPHRVKWNGKNSLLIICPARAQTTKSASEKTHKSSQPVPSSLFCHSERSEESKSALTCGHPIGFFADAQNDRKVCLGSFRKVCHARGCNKRSDSDQIGRIITARATRTLRSSRRRCQCPRR